LGEWLLPQDAALFAVQAGDWRAGVGEWRAAVRINPQYLMAASASLGRAPEAEREELLRRLLEDAEEPTAQWLAADLLARWGRGDEGWVLLDQSLPEDRRQAVMLLRRFVATAGEVSGPEAARARGFALERLAGMATGAEADRLRLDAARAFADAGSPESAQRLLSGIRTTDSGRGGVETAGTLIGVLADAGQVARADSLYREWAERLPGSQRDAIEARLAAGWLAVGSLERAEQVLGDDSTVAALALRGWIALFRGNLTDAAERFRAAGPTTGSRDDATRRAAALVTIERVSRERFPELGEAELAVYQGDTARGVALLERAANELPPVEGRADLLARAGMLAARSGATQAALRLLPAALAADSAGPAAPGAEFALASLYADLGRDALAAQHLEHLILTRSGSAVIPLARRLLDRVRGRIPRS
jgi:tetratricopeptide (TPR) repeat protein